jgi:hypothetical protein
MNEMKKNSGKQPHLKSLQNCIISQNKFNPSGERCQQ